MILCDYRTDLGDVKKLVRPRLNGVNTNTNESISPSDILLIVSNYVPINAYYERPDKSAVCPYSGRKRRLIMDLGVELIDIEYPEPFTQIDWTVFDSLNIRVETLPEFISDGEIRQFLKDF